MADIPWLIRVKRKTDETEILWREGTEEELRRLTMLLLRIGENALACPGPNENEQEMEESSWATDA